MRIAVMGTGGVGGYFGGRLAAAGQDVNFIARGAHLEALRRSGLRITSALGDATIAPAQATDDPAAIGPVDLVIFTVKLYDTEAAADAIRPLIGRDTGVVTFQNGISRPRGARPDARPRARSWRHRQDRRGDRRARGHPSHRYHGGADLRRTGRPSIHQGRSVGGSARGGRRQAHGERRHPARDLGQNGVPLDLRRADLADAPADRTDSQRSGNARPGAGRSCRGLRCGPRCRDRPARRPGRSTASSRSTGCPMR